MKLISLVPSLSHSLADLGLRKQLVGITKFCVEPPSLHRACRMVGGTKDPDLPLIESLQPTHIVVNEEENRLQDITQLRGIAKVINTFPKAPQDVPAMLRLIANELELSPSMSQPWLDSAREIESELVGLKPPASSKRFLYFIWKDPFMVAGRDTYISKSLSLLGFENAYLGSERYPQIDLNEWLGSVDFVFLSTEPYPFRKRDVEPFLPLRGPELLK